MSGTYKLDGEFFPTNPIAKRWRRQEVASGGEGASIYAGFWSIELDFPTLETAPGTGSTSFFYDAWIGGGLHTAQLPHPRDGNLTGFTGVNIKEWAYELDDVDADNWAQGPRLVLDRISMSATGSV